MSTRPNMGERGTVLSTLSPRGQVHLTRFAASRGNSLSRRCARQLACIDKGFVYPELREVLIPGARLTGALRRHLLRRPKLFRQDSDGALRIEVELRGPGYSRSGSR